MEDLTIEQELVARIFMHKVAITGSVLVREYLDKQEGIPEFLIRDKASDYSQEIIQNALSNGTFDTLYNRAWNEVKDILPEHLKIV